MVDETIQGVGGRRVENLVLRAPALVDVDDFAGRVVDGMGARFTGSW
jgi:hypothetical protein